MKIALITNFCTHYRYKLFKLLSEKYNFDIILFGDPKKTKEDIKHLGVLKDDNFKFIPVGKLFIYLLKSKYDVIIKCTNNKWSFLLSFLAAKLTRAKFIVWHTMWYYPNTLQYKLFSWFLIKVLKDYSDAIVVYGEHGKRFLIEKGINADKIFIAWQTVDNELYGRNIKDEEIEEIRRKYNINEKVILYVGRLVNLKGIEYLLECLKKLKDEGIKFTIVFCGDGKIKEAIEKYCEENNIDYRITGIIPYDKLPPFYKFARVLCLPSITTKTFKEPWGLVVNEAFNQGCPVVVTDAVGAGVGGLVKDGVNGFVVPEKNADALADAIGEILENEVIYNKLSMNAKEEIKKWTYERQAKGFLDAVNYALKLK
ncbi:glycosyltransferase family 4 protein [Caldisericum sp.]|uniref:glycosyltransferase family 4 protein n=1 Tax=Caldisericum sp. TaxID=2499687 RepID=UPI003D10B1ED